MESFSTSSNASLCECNCITKSECNGACKEFYDLMRKRMQECMQENANKIMANFSAEYRSGSAYAELIASVNQLAERRAREVLSGDSDVAELMELYQKLTQVKAASDEAEAELMELYQNLAQVNAACDDIEGDVKSKTEITYTTPTNPEDMFTFESLSETAADFDYNGEDDEDPRYVGWGDNTRAEHAIPQ